MIITIPKRQISSDEVAARISALDGVLWSLRDGSPLRPHLSAIRNELEEVLEQCRL